MRFMYCTNYLYLQGEGELPEGSTEEACQEIATNLEEAIFLQEYIQDLN